MRARFVLSRSPEQKLLLRIIIDSFEYGCVEVNSAGSLLDGVRKLIYDAADKDIVSLSDTMELAEAACCVGLNFAELMEEK